MSLIEHPSPNHDARPAGTPIDMLVLHYTGMPTGAAALGRLCDASAKVSAHYVVEEDGRVFRLVAEKRRAWHAGVGCWRGHRDVNARSIGIEIVNPGHEFGYRSFPAKQMAALRDLARDILGRHPIPTRNVVAHSDVAPERKEDPGELFDWSYLASKGVGLWPTTRAASRGRTFKPGERDPAIADAQAKLARWGYDVPTHGTLDAQTGRVLVAFQRHFRPERFDGRLDAGTLARLDALLHAVDG
ncbi:MAG: N-acetylmuramoyl-L-alanine amidase [Alphaproteobacteria bacterium]|nr:N-acetylmuramoyl-L-alanine amidase [Alphaproteobacteria bacterium]